MNFEKSNGDLNSWKELFKSHFSPVNMMADFIKYPVTTEKSYFSMFKNYNSSY